MRASAALLRTLAATSLIAVTFLCLPNQAHAADKDYVCQEKAPDPKVFPIGAIAMEGLKNTGAVTDVYFSVKSLRTDEIGTMTFHLTFSKRGETVKTMRYQHVFPEPLRRLEVEQVHVSLLYSGGHVGGFCDANMSSCGSVSIRVVSVCYIRSASNPQPPPAVVAPEAGGSARTRSLSPLTSPPTSSPSPDAASDAPLWCRSNSLIWVDGRCIPVGGKPPD
jgi:hypothetical protein